MHHCSHYTLGGGKAQRLCFLPRLSCRPACRSPSINQAPCPGTEAIDGQHSISLIEDSSWLRYSITFLLPSPAIISKVNGRRSRWQRYTDPGVWSHRAGEIVKSITGSSKARETSYAWNSDLVGFRGQTNLTPGETDYREGTSSNYRYVFWQCCNDQPIKLE